MARHDVEYFAYGPDLAAATWGVPTEVALLPYHRLALARPIRGGEPALSLVRDPEGEVPGLVFRLSWAEFGRAMNLVAITWPRRLDRVTVTAPGDQVLSVVTSLLDVVSPPSNVPREYAARMRALYQDHGVNAFALEGALAHASECFAGGGVQ